MASLLSQELESESDTTSAQRHSRRGFSLDHQTNAILHRDLTDIEDSFGLLNERFNRLDDQLRDFLHECRQLGRSYALILAAEALKEDLACILRLFHHNAAELALPLRVRAPDQLLNETSHPMFDHEHFPDVLERLAGMFEELRERLHDYGEYTNESAHIKRLMGSFAKDLAYRASCLNHYRDQLGASHIRLHIHGIAEGMRGDLDKIITAFRFFNTYGLPAIQYEQRRDSEGVMNLATVATFFSAVTATVLQISIPQHMTPVLSTVNTFWFCSLVLSIGAALNSLLAVAWRRTTYGTHGPRLPLWIYVWMHASAPVFMTFSIASFSTGLVLFTYACGQARYTYILTLACTVITSLGLVVICTWIAYEQWGRFATRGHGVMQRLRSQLGPTAISGVKKDTAQDHDPDTDTDACANANTDSSRPDPDPDPENQRPARQRTETPGFQGMKAGVMTTVRGAARVLIRGIHSSSISINLPERPTLADLRADAPQISPFKLLFDNQTTGKVLGRTQGEVRDLEFSRDGHLLAVTSFDSRERYSSTVIRAFDAQNVQEQHRVIVAPPYKHSAGKICHQISWSSDGHLLARLDNTIDVFDTTIDLPKKTAKLERIRTIKRPHSIKAATWCHGTALYILSVENSVVFRLSLEGHVITKHHFDNFRVRDISIVPKTNLLLVVGRVSYQHKDLTDKSRAEIQLLLYDMTTNECKSRVPILDGAAWATAADYPSVGQESCDVLVGHRNQRPPQLWTLGIGKDDSKLTPASVHMQNPEIMTGPGHFAGDQHQMICCSTAGGDIRIWNRQSGEPVERFAAQVVQTGWRCMAWTPAVKAGPVSCVTAAKDELRIWTAAMVSRNPVPLLQIPGPLHGSAPNLSPISDQPSHEDSERQEGNSGQEHL